jgi:surfeit locus 1 family protein
MIQLFSINNKAFYFKPKKIVTIGFIIAFCILSKLGFWQLDRYSQTQSILDKEALETNSPILNLSDILSQISPEVLHKDKPEYSEIKLNNLEYKTVKLSGSIDNSRNILLDNQILDGQPGYTVLSPLKLPQNKIIYINRGWIPLGKSRKELPAIDLIEEEITILGEINIVKHNPFIKNPIEPGATKWPLRVQEMDFNKLQELIKPTIIPIIIKLDDTYSFTYKQMPKASEWLVPDRHKAYSLQWFSMAFILLIIFISTNLKVIYSNKKSP